jgi:hypothetical protein
MVTDKVGILKANTWYLVRLKDSIKSIGGFRNGDVNQPIVGKSWKNFLGNSKQRMIPSLFG